MRAGADPEPNRRTAEEHSGNPLKPTLESDNRLSGWCGGVSLAGHTIGPQTVGQHLLDECLNVGTRHHPVRHRSKPAINDQRRQAMHQ